MHAAGRTEWVLGLNFFRNYYTVFDYSGPRLGFADSINKGKPSVSTEFIDWATGKQSSSDLSNLSTATPIEQQTSEIKVCICALVIISLVFGIYY